MEYILLVGLTSIVSWSIIKVMRKNIKEKSSLTIYSQNDMHRLLKYFFSIDSSSNKKRLSQLTKHTEKSMIKVMVIDQEAYWVSNNTFYVAKTIDGEVEPGSAQPVDIANMSKNEIDKMLFILDNLESGKKNDSGSAGN